ncbi:MAG: DUF4190 domain-containing protein [Ilumatobacteraceae bacterium]
MRSVSELAGDRHSGTNRMSIAALVLGILSIPMCFVFLPAILALGFGIAALVQVSNRPGQSGRRLAVTGIVLGAIGLVLPIVVFFALRDADAAIDMRAA